MKMPWPGARGDAATRNAAGQLRHGADIFSLSANARSRRRKETPSEGLQISRKHVAANPALCAPACVGQASRLFPSKEIPSPFGGRHKLLKPSPQGDYSKSETGATPVLRHRSGLEPPYAGGYGSGAPIAAFRGVESLPAWAGRGANGRATTAPSGCARNCSWPGWAGW